MAIFSILYIILCLVSPIVLVILIILLVSRKHQNNGSKDNFEKIIRSVYTYTLVLIFLCASIVSFIYSVNTTAEYLLPEEKIYYNEGSNKKDEELEKKNNDNEMIVNMITSMATFVVSLPMFVYHIKLTKKDK